MQIRADNESCAILGYDSSVYIAGQFPQQSCWSMHLFNYNDNNRHL